MRPRTLLTALGIAIALTLVSALVQRVGPLVTVEGEGFCDDGGRCRIPALGAGFPLAYLIDDPQISVPNAVSPFEDHVSPAAFLTDLVFYLTLVIVGIRLRERRRAKRRAHDGPRPAPPSP